MPLWNFPASIDSTSQFPIFLLTRLYNHYSAGKKNDAAENKVQ